ncbi:no apical meristem-associated, C-terminal domain-containing protein [Artemisia annua]|uniref:No apical meristem-associated, C-terminal domain-containing protein n=1 Tax=Artemisia annua TaxID=35608 RepID=A0A2U1KCW0_ARTAN|nr:no apical meristem-associated, C-terminal domain-containing protein [Artemisia annua]
MKPRVSFFSAKYNQLYENRKSGQNDEDILKAAHNDYKAEKGHPFAYMHVWEVLKSCEKWKRNEIPNLSGGSFKKSKTSETNSCSVPFDLNLEFDDDFGDSQSSQATERKRKAKGKGTSTSSPNMEAALSRMEEGFSALMNHVYEFQKRDDARDKKKEELIQTQKKLVEATEKQAKAYEDKQRNKDLDYYYTEFEGLRGKRLEHVQKRKKEIKEKYNLED